MIIDYLCVGAHVIAGRDFLYTSVFGDPSDITLGATYFIFIDSLLLLYHVIFEKYLIKNKKKKNKLYCVDEEATISLNVWVTTFGPPCISNNDCPLVTAADVK